MKIFSQIIEMIDLGLVILDDKMRVRFWNRWLESHSDISREDISGKSILECFPHLDNPKFRRNFKAVFAFGNFYFFSKKFHDYLFPFKPDSSFISEVKNMQQSCTMGPLRDDKNDIRFVFISIKDVTEATIFEKKLTDALFNMLETGGDPNKSVPESVLTDLFSSTVDNPFAVDLAETAISEVEKAEVSKLSDDSLQPEISSPSIGTDSPAETTPKKSQSVADSPQPVSTSIPKADIQGVVVQKQIQELRAMISPAALSSNTSAKKKKPKRKRVQASQSKKMSRDTRKSVGKKRKAKKVDSGKSSAKGKQNKKATRLTEKPAKQYGMDEQIEGLASIIDFAVDKPADQTNEK
ncbi:PAS domain-containing protein [Thermodesulfobacteriota bacterium]